MPLPPKNLNEFQSLIEVVAHLRGPEGCPWDKEQTHNSLTRYTIEECYELVDALINENDAEIKDELGDVLFQVLLHSQIASETNRFTINDVIDNLNKKMVRRHPHVFSTTKVKDINEVWKNWDAIKAEEKQGKLPATDSFGIPKHLDSLAKSVKIGEKSKKNNFDWRTPEDVFLKVQEEVSEVQEALASKSKEELEDEIGDLLFSVCQLARHAKLNPHTCLKKANDKFESRFFKMKKLIESKNESIHSLPDDQLESYWQETKSALSSTNTLSGAKDE